MNATDRIPEVPEFTVVGCGPGAEDYLTPRASACIERAQLLIGTQRLIDRFASSRAHKLVYYTITESWLDRIETIPARPCVVLVSGDPGTSDITGVFVRRFGPRRCRVEPGVSAIQLACANLGVTWQNAAIVDVQTSKPTSLATPSMERDPVDLLDGRRNRGALDCVARRRKRQARVSRRRSQPFDSIDSWDLAEGARHARAASPPAARRDRDGAPRRVSASAFAHGSPSMSSQGKLILVGGGARSGKSRFALALAESLGPRRTFVATAQALDGEMRTRIERHQRERELRAFRTVECPLAVPETVAGQPDTDVILIDCLTLWIANLLGEERTDDEILTRVDELVAAAVNATVPVIVVSNEVGLGLVAMNELGRRFQDVTGWAHQRLAAAASEIYFAALGCMMCLKPSPLRLVSVKDLEVQ
ncbi:MAG: bifunctional adenosylcobinamide kinase/adenosylcobinamide-phosphate guanylyltransferase [Polyangiaceae bacterium]